MCRTVEKVNKKKQKNKIGCCALVGKRDSSLAAFPHAGKKLDVTQLVATRCDFNEPEKTETIEII